MELSAGELTSIINQICSKFHDLRRRQAPIDCRSLGCCACACCEKRHTGHVFERPLNRSMSSGGASQQHFDLKDAASGPAASSTRKSKPRQVGKPAITPSISDSLDDCYKGVKKPYVLIINNIHFHTMPAPRGGAVADIENLVKFFRDSGFESIVVQYNLMRHEMLSLLESTRTQADLVDHDAFICVIMTHGDAKGLKGTDDQQKSIAVEQVTSLFTGNKCPQMMTKPKLFFIQACRGVREDQGYFVPRGHISKSDQVTDDAEEEMVMKMPSEADILVAYSTTKDHRAYRRITDDEQAMLEHRSAMGSWFISCMVQVFKKFSGKEDLMTMMVKVNRAMTQLYTGGDPASGYRQISCQLSMLTKKLYFAKYWEQEKH